MVMAEALAKLLTDEKLMCSAGWISMLHHNISCGKISGKASAVDCEMQQNG
jgi:hypothetical protein